MDLLATCVQLGCSVLASFLCPSSVKSLTLAGVVTSVGTVFESVKNTWRYHLGTVELS